MVLSDDFGWKKYSADDEFTAESLHPRNGLIRDPLTLLLLAPLSSECLLKFHIDREKYLTPYCIDITGNILLAYVL